jgi:dihydrofolate synthase/folylpolyglutamate synthase
MSYPDSVRYLYALGNEIRSAKLGLDRMQALLERLGHPERRGRFVHVAGTNGKGSTCALIDAALRAAGHRTGLFTSPHLIEPTERIRIGGRPVSPADFAAAFDRVHAAALALLAEGRLDHHPSYFETVTAMGFLLFAEAEAGYTVLEVGLGGRLDATNVVLPALCAITRIDYDHQQFLGDTIEQIAAEKAGILKPGVPAVFGPQRPEAEAVLEARARELKIAPVRAAEQRVQVLSESSDGTLLAVDGLEVFCPLAGRHQVENAATAIAALRRLGISAEAIQEGFRAARWPGRLQLVCRAPEILVDGAHNPNGAEALAAHLRRFYAGRRITLIYASMRDKPVAAIGRILFPLAETVILTAPATDRALPPDELARLTPASRLLQAPHLGAAWELIRDPDLVVITGSLFLAGEAIRRWDPAAGGFAC